MPTISEQIILLELERERALFQRDIAKMEEFSEEMLELLRGTIVKQIVTPVPPPQPQG